MKKAIGQTVRDLKREVNKKVLKVPGIEQKVLDATSNEPWGPHGSLLADIAQATRNYHEYQMIMAVIWKRINDTGKNWRHVHKALTVLEYLVANGSERVIDEIREHAYQISTLSNFQYIDSSGRDQGNNVRKKSQSLILLVNDKERIIEVREKAAANRDKFHNNSTGGMYRPGSYSGSGAYGDRYDGDRYGHREEDRSGYGREREWGSRDDDRYGRDGDRYGRDYEERYDRDGYRDDEYRGRSQSIDDNQSGPRSRSSDRDHDHNYDDHGQHSSRGNSAQVEDRSLEGRLDQKFSEKSMGAPPSYEEVIGEYPSPLHGDRERETSTAYAPGGSSPPASYNPHQSSASTGSSPPVNYSLTEATATAAANTTTTGNQQAEASDEFDPRGPVSAAPAPAPAPAPATPNNVEMELLGSLSESLSSNAFALVPSASATTTTVGNANLDSTASYAAPSSRSNNFNQSFEDPFGDSPFKAIPSAEIQSQTYQSHETSQSSGTNAETGSNFGFGDSFSVVPHSASGASGTQPFSTNSHLSQDLSIPQQETDILADILPPAPLPGMSSQQNVSAPPAAQPLPSLSASSGQVASQYFFAQTGQLMLQGFSAPEYQPAQAFSVPPGQLAQQAFSAPNGQRAQPSFSAPASQHAQQPSSAHAAQPSLHAFLSTTDQSMQPPFISQLGQSSGHIYSAFHSQSRSLSPGASNMLPPLSQSGHDGSMNSGNFLPQGSTAPIPSHMASQVSTGQVLQSATANYFPSHGGSSAHTTSHLASQSPTDQASQFNSGSFIAQQGTVAPFTHQQLGMPGGKQNNVAGSLLGQAGASAPNASQKAVSSTGPNQMVSQQPKHKKFETKSTVWADTLSKGLVNLNISGPKINPLADIGIDFDAINRKEKRMEKPTTTTVTSTVTMGKAMGSGSGMGRAGAGAIRPPPNPMMGSGMGSGPGVGMGMGGYGGMNAPMGMGMNMGMGQGVHMQLPTGLPLGQGNFNPMMGTGGYPRQPYGGGYR